MDYPRILSLVEEYNKAIASLEQDAIARLTKSLDVSLEQLLKRLNSKYPDIKNNLSILPAQRLLLITSELGELLNIVSRSQEEKHTEIFKGLITEGHRLGAEEATELVKMVDPNFEVASYSKVPIKAAAIAASQTYKNLLGYGEQFANNASNVISQGIIQGLGNRKIAGVLRAMEEKATKVQVERIVRTETARAAIGAVKQLYTDSDLRYGVWITTVQDVCPWCIGKSGKIYRIKDMVIPQHFNCRCSILPVAPDWVRDGFFDFVAIDNYSEFVREGKRVRADKALFEAAPPQEVTREKFLVAK
ncbi:MAG: hypothetical protein F6J98_01855 [Moorea sp. SIO4G2]|nr:hypothetical protein [Moorena sp. SIO4G2]